MTEGGGGHIVVAKEFERPPNGSTFFLLVFRI
jgi:hypothetical protein